MKLNKTIDTFIRKKLSLIIGAFALALLLWIFVVSENEYTLILDLPIEARNLHAQKAHKEEFPSYASVRLRGTGRDLFKSFILKNYAGFKLVLDLEGISKEYEFVLNEYFKKYPQKVVLPFNYNVSFVEVLYPNRIKISLDEYSTKSVPVICNFHINPAPGFILVNKPIIIPSEIEIAGPRKELALINHVETIFDTVNGLAAYYKGDIEIQSLGRLIELSSSSVQIAFDIQDISERIIANIPVKVINIPDKIRVFPSPQTVSLTIVGGIGRIATIVPEDIEVFVDFNNWNHGIQFYEPVVNIPNDILDWRDISPKNLEIGVARELK
ncbi:MAG: YbbR-like domain-containing protein [Candidatus Neomarinimicrobiota bacterium]